MHPLSRQQLEKRRDELKEMLRVREGLHAGRLQPAQQPPVSTEGVTAGPTHTEIEWIRQSLGLVEHALKGD